MGNSIALKTTEESGMLEITEKLLEDFQHHISLVDRSLVGFAKSVDAMRASCAVLQKSKTERPDTAVVTGSDVGTEAARLLETVDEIVSDHKFVAIESLSRFFAFIIGMGSGFIISEEDTALLVDQYRHQNLTYTDSDSQYYDLRIEFLQRKNKTLRDELEILKETEKALNDREVLYQNEKKNLKTKHTNLEFALADMKTEVKKVSEENKVKDQRNEQLLREKAHYRQREIYLENEIQAERSKRDDAEKENKAEKDESINEIETLKKTLNERMTTIDELQLEKDSLRNENSKLSEDLREANVSIELLKNGITSSVTSLSTEIKNMKAECHTLGKDYQKEIQSVKEVSEQENNSVKKLILLLEDIKDQDQYRCKEDREWKSNISMQEENVSTLVKTLKDEVKDMRLSAASVETNMEKMVTELKKTEDVHVEVQKNLKELIEQEKSAKEEFDRRLEDIKDQLQRQHQEKQTNLDLLNDEIKDFISEFRNKWKANISLQEENLSTSSNVLYAEVKDSRKSIEQLYESEPYRLRKCLNTEKALKDECATELHSMENNSQQHEEEMIPVEIEVGRLKSEIVSLQSEVKNKVLQIEVLNKDHKIELDRNLIEMEELKGKYKDQKKENDEMRENVKELKEKNCSLTLDLQKEADKHVDILEDKATIINLLKGKIERMKKDFEGFKELKDKEKQECLNEVKQLKEKQKVDLEDIHQLNSETMNLKKVITVKDEAIKKLEQAANSFLHVQVQYNTKYSVIAEIGVLQNELKRRMADQCIDLNFLDCTQPFSPLSTDLPYLIVCVRPGRTNRDKFVSNVIEHVNATPKTALLIFHKTDEEAFRKDMASVKTSIKHGDQTVLIFDIGYRHEIYKNNINNKNVERLFDFLNREGVLKSRITYL